jgi:hypothetical protein
LQLDQGHPPIVMAGPPQAARPAAASSGVMPSTSDLHPG